jgi:uncharacterized protein YbbK (DUF523 family)
MASPNTERMIVSACLVGVECKWDGTSNANAKVIDLFNQGGLTPVCPEMLGDLKRLRPPAVREGNRVFTNEGRDVTTEFYRGARKTLKVAQALECRKAILKARSPSCGSEVIYRGFDGEKTEGDGITAEVLKAHGIKVITEEDL